MAKWTSTAIYAEIQSHLNVKAKNILYICSYCKEYLQSPPQME